jgi:transposase
MEYVGVDLHKRESQICILGETGEVPLEQRIRTSRERFADVLTTRGRARVLIEAATESEWVARCLEALGLEVVVADPNFAAMYATRSKRVKTDRRDARTLAEAARLGAYRQAHRTSEEQRHVRSLLASRDALITTRTKLISVANALLRRDGWRIRSGEAETYERRLRALALPAATAHELRPILSLLAPLNEQIGNLDKEIAAIADENPVVRRLRTVPGIGAVIGTAFVATIDQVARFGGAHQVEAYLGLVPRELSSGEKQHRGSITKAGNTRMRWLLVQAAWSVMRSRRAEAAGLRAWAARLAGRRGKRIAAVALARKLAGILFAIFRDETTFHATTAAEKQAA